MPPSHIPIGILPPLTPPSLPSLRATFATKKPIRIPKRSLRPDASGHKFRPSPIQKRPETSTSSQSSRTEPSSADAVSIALRDASAHDNNLLAPVHVPEDPNATLKEKHPASKILSTSAIVVQRQLEIMNLVIGFEQANKYTIMDPQGNHLGFMAERDLGTGNMVARQMFKTHRSFETNVFDKHGREVLRVSQPFGEARCVEPVN